jgi:NhaP-type Na+/H+ or K+/H+ antiporter
MLSFIGFHFGIGLLLYIVFCFVCGTGAIDPVMREEPEIEATMFMFWELSVLVLIGALISYLLVRALSNIGDYSEKLGSYWRK